MFEQYKCILVALDGSDESEQAFQKAIYAAKRNDATLHLTHVVDTRAFQNINSYDGSLSEQTTEFAEKMLQEYKTAATDLGVKKVTYSVEFGSPKALIAKQLPEELNVDLIMLGATGLNRIERLLIGSVSDYVIRHAKCDVLVVRTGIDNKPDHNEKKEQA